MVHVIIPTFRRLRKENCEFEAHLGNLVRPCLKINHNICKYPAIHDLDIFQTTDGLVLHRENEKLNFYKVSPNHDSENMVDEKSL